METIDDIVREMRACAADCTASGCRDMERFADRIEKAFIECLKSVIYAQRIYNEGAKQ